MKNKNTGWHDRLFKNQYLAVFLRILVGLIFLFSGFTKLPMHSQFVGIVESYNILPHLMAMAYALALPWVELIIGSYLILGIQVRVSAVISLLMAVSFMVANVSLVIQGEAYCGGCFGDVFSPSVSQALIIDIVIIVAAIYLYRVGRQILSFDNLFIRGRLT